MDGKITHKEVAEKIGVPPRTFSRWWARGAGNASIRAANLVSLAWTREVKGQDVGSYVSLDDVVDREGFQRQIKTIWPGICDGRKRSCDHVEN